MNWFISPEAMEAATAEVVIGWDHARNRPRTIRVLREPLLPPAAPPSPEAPRYAEKRADELTKGDLLGGVAITDTAPKHSRAGWTVAWLANGTAKEWADDTLVTIDQPAPASSTGEAP